MYLHYWMWTLIQFVDDDDYDVIPSRWVTSNTTCVFPAGKFSWIKALVKNNATPQDEWETLNISIVIDNIGDYNTAIKMLFRTVKKVPLFSDDEKGRGFRQKKPTRILGSDTDEEIEEVNIEKKSTIIEKKKPKKIYFLVDVVKIKANLKYLKENASEKIVTDTIKAIAFEEDLFPFPVKTEEDLENLEVQLTKLSNEKKLIAILLNHAEGKSVPKVVGSIMTRVISNELASTYSWKGQKNKKPFQGKELAKAVIVSVLNKFPSESKQDVIKSIQLWLAQSPTRLKRAQNAIATNFE
ncbi:hypothetical protein RN001_006987 [Aquatica leii]|uniref:DUF4806 domain-containing protein n=1 Tax=Aquatica leii TaxID=1421715 RepID=A0AAN7QLN8_9COLE|nr:hypothetical protein RN001_006987 [Aquatica leii]